MHVEISRITNTDLESLFRRPRVSYRISEYVFSYINEKILQPNRILQSPKQHYWFTLSFSFFIPRPNRIRYQSPFSTASRLFISHKGFRMTEGKKWAFLDLTAEDINQEIHPFDYALLVYDMFADYFINNYKKLEKEEFDRFRYQMDRTLIQSFPYPAPFEEQRYVLDDSQYGRRAIGPGETLEDSLIISPKEEYLKRYGF